MLLFTRGQTVVVWPQGGAGGALRGEGDVVVNVLAPLHQQLGVDLVRPLGGASEYLPADLPWLPTGIQSVSGDESSQTTETLQLHIPTDNFNLPDARVANHSPPVPQSPAIHSRCCATGPVAKRCVFSTLIGFPGATSVKACRDKPCRCA